MPQYQLKPRTLDEQHKPVDRIVLAWT